jgi:hypothetical protein
LYSASEEVRLEGGHGSWCIWAGLNSDIILPHIPLCCTARLSHSTLSSGFSHFFLGQLSLSLWIWSLVTYPQSGSNSAVNWIGIWKIFAWVLVEILVNYPKPSPAWWCTSSVEWTIWWEIIILMSGTSSASRVYNSSVAWMKMCIWTASGKAQITGYVFLFLALIISCLINSYLDCILRASCWSWFLAKIHATYIVYVCVLR